MISSPYARKGELWRVFSKHYGPTGDPLILVAQGASRVFNPTLPQSVVDRAMERDPASASAEFLAEFRRDIESFVAIEAVQACVSTGVYERAPQRGVGYAGFCDPSGGSRRFYDAGDRPYRLHKPRDDRRSTVYEKPRPPFSPEVVTSDFCALLTLYGLNTSDRRSLRRYLATEQFSQFGVICTDAVEKPESLCRRSVAAEIQRIDLPDNTEDDQSAARNLERRIGRGGRISSIIRSGMQMIVSTASRASARSASLRRVRISCAPGSKVEHRRPVQSEDSRRFQVVEFRVHPDRRGVLNPW